MRPILPTRLRPTSRAVLGDRRLDRTGRLTVAIAMVVLFAKIGGVSSPGYGWPSWKPWTWRPGPLFRNTLTTGGDTGAHVWTPWFVRHHLLASFTASGWSKDWYAGFPVLQFYFPGPSWAIVLLGFLMPANLAFKFVTVAGVLTLPFASMMLARAAGLDNRFRYLFALASMAFLFDPHYTILGGNILSTMAGEFSFSISLTSGIVFLALLMRVLKTGRGRPLAVVALTIAALSHLLPTVFICAAAVFVLLTHLPMRTPTSVRRRILDTAFIGLVAGLLVAFWIVPFHAHLAYTNDVGWETAKAYLAGLFPPLAKPSLTGAGMVGGVVVLALIGGIHQSARFIAALRRRREPDAEARIGTALTSMAAAAALAFRFPPSFRVLNERALPFYLLSCFLLATFGLMSVGRCAISFVRRIRPARRVSPGIAVGAVGILLWWSFGSNLAIVPGFVPIPKVRGWDVGVQRADSTDDINPVATWATENYNGYEATTEWPELRTIADTMGRIGRTNGCGRAMWDYEDQLSRYGTEDALMLLPMWTKGCIGSMEGLYYESSATVPYHFVNASWLSGVSSDIQALVRYPGLNVAQGVKRLQQWGIRYYLLFSPKAITQARADPDLRLRGSVPFNRDCEKSEKDSGTCPSVLEIYEVLHAELVAGLPTQPAVVTGIGQSQRGGWLDVAMAQYLAPADHPVPLAADGPKEWERVHASVKRTATTKYGESVQVDSAAVLHLAAVAVSDIREGNGKVSFHVDRVGVPVVVKESYFPTWRAKGASGPWRLAPNMMVVVPTAHDVRLTIGLDGSNKLGMLLGLAGAAAFVGLLLKERRQRTGASPER